MTDPRSLAEFWDLLPVAAGTTWTEKRNDELGGTGGGDSIPIELATPLWSGEVVLDFSEWPEARRLAARVRSLEGSRQTFLMPNPIAEYPAADPDGSILGANAVTIAAIGSDNHSISFTGLPAGYQLGWGDLAEVVFSSNPVRHYVFELHGDVTADPDGLSQPVAVYPHVWPGVIEGAAVNFRRPAAKMLIVAGSLREGVIRSGIVDGMSFSVLQRP